jgi:hypothetical protein
MAVTAEHIVPNLTPSVAKPEPDSRTQLANPQEVVLYVFRMPKKDAPKPLQRV